jgi:hypothetical protein
MALRNFTAALSALITPARLSSYNLWPSNVKFFKRRSEILLLKCLFIAANQMICRKRMVEG